MLGFDYKYQGNSKYLFNYLKDKYNPTKLKFVTSDKRIPEDYRIEPRSKEFFNAFYTSKVIIAESWIPLAFKKKEGQVWLQLWHGTPFKKMLFDSNESHMLRLNPNHRIRMKKDIARWDYLLSDSELAKSIFNTSFDFNYNKILNYG
ncbi:CDP-glycerol glycerophosphotransferase family protein, partial [Staphylococcus ureilyticus]|nr:CDP-glycerol glycerophosphotransferase family protein [Staphylococcus ureilyticus]